MSLINPILTPLIKNVQNNYVCATPNIKIIPKNFPFTFIHNCVKYNSDFKNLFRALRITDSSNGSFFKNCVAPELKVQKNMSDLTKIEPLIQFLLLNFNEMRKEEKKLVEILKDLFIVPIKENNEYALKKACMLYDISNPIYEYLYSRNSTFYPCKEFQSKKYSIFWRILGIKCEPTK